MKVRRLARPESSWDGTAGAPLSPIQAWAKPGKPSSKARFSGDRPEPVAQGWTAWRPRTPAGLTQALERRAKKWTRFFAKNAAFSRNPEPSAIPKDRERL